MSDSLPVEGGSVPFANEADSGVEDPLRRLVRGGLLNLVGAAVFGLGSFAFFIVAARALPAAESGALFESVALFVMLLTIANLGTPVGLVRTLAGARATGRTGELRPTILVALVPVVAASVLLSLALFLAAPEIAPLVARRADPATVTTYVRVISVLVPFGAVLTAVLAATQALGTMVPTNAVDNLLQPALRLVLAGGIALGATATVYVPLAWTLPAVAGLLVATPWLRSQLIRAEARHGRDATPRRSVRELAREFWTFTSFRSLGGVVQIALIWLDVLLVGALASAREAGVYAAASRYLVAGTLVNTAIINVLAPEVSASFARGRHSETVGLYRRATLWLVAVTVPMYLLMAVYAPLLMRVFGARFESGSHALLVLSLAMVASMAAGPVMAVLLMGGKSTWNVVDLAAALAVNIGANVALVPRYGITGAAAAYAASILLVNLLPLAQVYRWWRLHPFAKSYALLLGCCLLAFGALALALRLGYGATVGAFVAACGGASACYLAALWLLHPIVDLGLPFSLARVRLALAGQRLSR